MFVLGIMSGTSIDSVDYALCSVSLRQIQLLRQWQVKYPRLLQQRLHQAAQSLANAGELAQLHHDLGRFYARHALPDSLRVKPELAGLHGQTVFHRPSRTAPAILQLGEPAYLAEMLRVPVVSNFRAADVAAGGEGAPLATVFHRMVFGRKGQHVCVNNLGGISNITSIDSTLKAEPTVLAFDTGPANVLIDLAMRYFTRGQAQMDRNGAWAVRGRVCETALKQWLTHPYFLRKPPKSTGRELFGEPFWQRVLPQMRTARLSRFDIVATLTELTARSLALNCKLHLKSWPQTFILTGGGAANPALVKSIQAALAAAGPGTELLTSEMSGWPLQSVEPAAFALLAYLRIKRQTGNLPQTTGARRAVRLGQISDP